VTEEEEEDEPGRKGMDGADESGRNGINCAKEGRMVAFLRREGVELMYVEWEERNLIDVCGV
jgi:hypothetical protein